MTGMSSALIRAALAAVASPDATHPCADHNPALWSLWCAVKGRNPMAPADHWTEADVVASFREMLNAAA